MDASLYLQVAFMLRNQSLLRIYVVLWIGTVATFGQCASVVEHLPSDSLGFIVVRDLARFDAKTEAWWKAFNAPFPGPMEFLKLAAGVSDGLNSHGEFMVAMLPGDHPQLCVWLPVENYERMIASLHGTAQESISAVTIAGEDLLMAKQGDWALLMDPDQRDVMETMIDAQPPISPRIAAWNAWMGTNDATVVLLPNGIRTAWNWTEKSSGGHPINEPMPEPADDLFGPGNNESEVKDGDAPSDRWEIIRKSMRGYLQDMPQLASAITETEAIAIGLRCDDQGNALVGVKVACQDGWMIANGVGPTTADKALPPSMFGDGEFVVSGAGWVPRSLATAAASVYVRNLTSGLRADFHTEFDDEAIGRLQDAVELAITDIRSTEVLRLPGLEKEGVYTNGFIALRVGSSAEFLTRAADVFRLWNEMSRDASTETQLVFETGKSRIANLDATQYSIDMAAAIGAPGLPEVRQSMEQLFGAGGKLRIFLLPIDDQTVLLATATEEQLAATAQTMLLNQPARLDRGTLKTSNQLLPQQADWRLFLSPHGYTAWLKRQMDAVLGPIIGGPIVREFPACSPVGIAGGFNKQELWIEAVLPADTIKQASIYLQQR